MRPASSPPKTTTPKSSEARDTRQALLDAAFEVFSSKGFFGSSLRDIARIVGVRESAIYHYFPSKEALFDALIEEEDELRAERILHYEELTKVNLCAFLENLGLRILERLEQPREQKLFRILLSDGLRLSAEGRIDLFKRFGAPPLSMLMKQLVREKYLRPMSSDVLWISFFAPFLIWLHLTLSSNDDSLVRDAHAFVRTHVDIFLRGASASPEP